MNGSAEHQDAEDDEGDEEDEKTVWPPGYLHIMARVEVIHGD